MKEAQVATIHAKYRVVEGYHVFTSDDVPGLYVSSKDGRNAFESVCPVLRELLSAKLRSPCAIEATMTYEQFVAYIEARQSMLAVPVLGNTAFHVRRVE